MPKKSRLIEQLAEWVYIYDIPNKLPVTLMGKINTLMKN